MTVRVRVPRATYRDAGLTDVATDLAQVVRTLNTEVRWKPEVVEPSDGAELRAGVLSLLLNGNTYYLPSSAVAGESVLVACEAGSATVQANTLIAGSSAATIGGKAIELFYTGKNWV